MAATEATGVAALGLDPWAIAAQAATFLLLFWVVKKFAMGKIVDTLEKRRQAIDDGVRLGREMEAQQKHLDKRAAEIMQNARIKGDELFAQSQKEAAELVKAAEQKAAARADSLIAEARIRIEEDVKSSRKQLETEMRTLVAEATEVILQEKIDAKKDDNLIKRAIEAVKNA